MCRSASRRPAPSARQQAQATVGLALDVQPLQLVLQHDKPLADDELEKTGTYALCFARWNGEPNCTTWVPHPDNYTFMPDVQLHIWHKPPSMPPPDVAVEKEGSDLRRI